MLWSFLGPLIVGGGALFVALRAQAIFDRETKAVGNRYLYGLTPEAYVRMLRTIGWTVAAMCALTFVAVAIQTLTNPNP